MTGIGNAIWFMGYMCYCMCIWSDRKWCRLLCMAYPAVLGNFHQSIQSHICHTKAALYSAPFRPNFDVNHYLNQWNCCIINFSLHVWSTLTLVVHVFWIKNVQIKHFISQCFKNMPLIAAIHHQQWMCYTFSSQPGKTSTNFLYSGDLTCGYTLSQVHNMLLSYAM